jgi:hypothetical protein
MEILIPFKTTCSTLGLISWWFTKEWHDNWSIFGQAPSVTDLGPNIFFILTLLSPTYFVVTFLDLQTRYIYLAYISKFAVSFKSNWILTLLKLLCRQRCGFISLLISVTYYVGFRVQSISVGKIAWSNHHKYDRLSSVVIHIYSVYIFVPGYLS